MRRDTSVCVFFKPPIVGTVKTRLIPTVGSNRATALAEAFFRDTWSTVESLDWAVPVLASAGPVKPDLLPRSRPGVWLQGDGDLGARLERILRKALEVTPFAIIVGTDSPGMPMQLLQDAHDSLQSSDSVLGPSEDGGFYLIGVRRCPAGLLANLPWSQSTTFARTWRRLTETGLNPAKLDPWYDIDWPEDLDRLREDLAAKTIVAPRTARVLADLASFRACNAAFPIEAAEDLNSQLGGANAE